MKVTKRKTIYQCDRCGRQMTKGAANFLYKGNYIKYNSESISYKGIKRVKILTYCNPCFEKFLDTINDFNQEDLW